MHRFMFLKIGIILGRQRWIWILLHMLRQCFIKCILWKVGSLVKLFEEMYIYFLSWKFSKHISKLKDLRGSTEEKWFLYDWLQHFLFDHATPINSLLTAYKMLYSGQQMCSLIMAKWGKYETSASFKGKILQLEIWNHLVLW